MEGSSKRSRMAVVGPHQVQRWRQGCFHARACPALLLCSLSWQALYLPGWSDACYDLQMLGHLSVCSSKYKCSGWGGIACPELAHLNTAHALFEAWSA